VAFSATRAEAEGCNRRYQLYRESSVSNLR